MRYCSLLLNITALYVSEQGNQTSTTLKLIQCRLGRYESRRGIPSYYVKTYRYLQRYLQVFYSKRHIRAWAILRTVWCYLIIIQGLFWGKLSFEVAFGCTVRLSANSHQPPRVAQQESGVGRIINRLKILNSFFKAREAFLPELLLRRRYSFTH